MSNFLLVSAQVWVLFALMAVGAVCRWTKLVDDAAIKGIVNVLILLVTPSLIIDVFQRPFENTMLVNLGIAFLIAFVAHIAIVIVATLLFRGGDDSRRPVLRLAMVFSNAGFMGIPLEYAILGDSGVFFGITYVVTFNFFFWSWGLWQMQKRFLNSHSSFLVNPGTIGLAIGLSLFLTRTTLPQIVAQPVKMMASLNTPLAMLVIGYYLAGAKFRSVIRCRGAYVASFLRLVAYPLVLMAVLVAFKNVLDRDMMLALIIAASAPVAAMVTMFSAKFGRDVDLSVGLVSATTLISAVTMPPIITFAMSIL